MTNPNDYPGQNPDEQPIGGQNNPDPQFGGYGSTPNPGGDPNLGGNPNLGGDPNYGGVPNYGAPQYGQPQYGQPQVGMPAGPPPPNSMASSIVVTVLSFLFMCASCISLVGGVFGIMAIVKANSVNSLWSMGDAAGSHAAAAEAKKWSNIAWIIFGVSIVLWIVLLIVLAVTGSGVGYYDFSTTN
ncbi:MAG: CD225/dispanin family protein [Gordonia sp. (in: high G+C Gram-positive bacteria)]|uniref:CD225/dispanin family protein n=1 Tax=Gordonia sp. (in: high G+C Gram-positive bacteria) TaxID=84139 RepID=UPI003C748E84